MKHVTLLCLMIVGLCSFTAQAQNQSTPEWIWHPDKNVDTVFFRATFSVDGPIKSAKIAATADNEFSVFVNGQEVLGGSEWSDLYATDISEQLKLGKNTFAVRAGNQGGPAAFVLQADVQGKQKTRLVTNSDWKCSDKQTAGWKLPAFDDSAWVASRSIGKVGGRDLPYSHAINANSFTDPKIQNANPFIAQVISDAIVMDGFQLEKLVEVPRNLGSWVSLTTAANGTLIACDQRGAGLYRITPGQGDIATKVKRIPVELSGAQGLLWAFDSLYVVVNGGEKSGLHRVTDTDNDGELDAAEHLMFLPGGGEHGPHAVILSPDKKSLFVCGGNHTELPKEISGSRIPRNWDEDLLLPRRWDANGHAAGRLAPGGWICKVDPAGKSWEVFSVGFRNEYDIAFNADGELFSYDADMEWDLGSPWYRPTRVVHASSGSEFGWRSGTGKWPTYYEDSLPPAVDIGPGSPVGIAFGYGAKFPAKYQKALFILDWTYSTIYAVHLTPDGSSYAGEKEDFVTGQPLQVTDVTIGNEGAMYFTVGGRGTQSSLYRVTYVGDESTEPVSATNDAGSDLRAMRHEMESLHGEDQTEDLGSISKILQHLGHEDRFIRYSARIALEARPIEHWREKALGANTPRGIINAVVAVARQGSTEDREEALVALGRLAQFDLDESMGLGALRAMQLVFARLGEPNEQERAAVLRVISPMFPSSSERINAELVQLLVYLDDPTVVEKTLAVIDELGEEPAPDWGYLVERHKGYGGTVGKLLENMPPARMIHYLFTLRNQNSGWTIASRKKYLGLFVGASKHPGGNSYGKFLSQIRDDALSKLTPDERVVLDDLASVSLLQEPPKVVPPKGPGRKWTRQEALPLVKDLRKRNFDRGRNLFHATQCAKCHRLGGEGGAIGPDLSTAGRKYPMPDLLDSLIEPSKAISDQYGSEKILTADGEAIVGRVVRIDGKLHIYTTDANAPPKIVDEDDVEQATPSKISQMPTGLIDTLNEEELKDLVAYLLSGGNRRDRVYRK